MAVSFSSQSFSKINYTQQPLPKGEYEDCSFAYCDFSAASLSGNLFIDCIFINCNLSLAKLHETLLRDVQFKDCKMLGLLFDTCNQFGLSFTFEDCTLNNTSFYKANIKKTIFKSCQLQEADFTEANLTEAVFNHCNLAGAKFENTILEKADLRTAYNYAIDPTTNKVKKAKFSLEGVTGLLGRFNIVIES
ncbi:MAG TPA: pentapeptide repeat-containing protein [Chitinophagaceae bacterium]|nr:pentapeptide repeat-containing protein [Chitinophagaceae bacterium]